MNADRIDDEVAAIVAAHAGIPIDQVGPGTRLWHDLKLAGDEFGEVIESLYRTHGVTLRGHLGDYCPTEGDIWRALWWWPFNFKPYKTYRELTLAELTLAARTGAYVG